MAELLMEWTEVNRNFYENDMEENQRAMDQGILGHVA